MKNTVVILVACILLGVGLAQAQTKAIEEHITILSSPDAPGTIHKTRIGTCVRELLQQWNLSEKNLPNLVVYHVSKKAAETAHVKGEVVARKNSATAGGSSYFEMWLVGEPKAAKYVLALENILEMHYGFTATEQKRKEVMARVFRMEDSILDVQQGK